MGKKTFDSWFQVMPFHPGLQHWKDGISIIKQWTSTDHKQLQQVFVPTLIGTPNSDVIWASRALLDFVYLAQYHSHTNDTLQALQDTLNDFHTLKDAYRIACHPHFPSRTAQFLVQHHGAVVFVEALQRFLADQPSPRPQGFQPTLHDHFNCFSNMQIPLQPLEHLSDDNETARICSHPEHANGPHKPPMLARYDTVLMRVDEQGRWMGGPHTSVRPHRTSGSTRMYICLYCWARPGAGRQLWYWYGR